MYPNLNLKKQGWFYSDFYNLRQPFSKVLCKKVKELF